MTRRSRLAPLPEPGLAAPAPQVLVAAIVCSSVLAALGGVLLLAWRRR